MTPFGNKYLQWSALATRMLLGVLFIVSAVAKLVEIDTFELYIFSYHLLPLTLSFLAARLVIVAEMLCGIGLLANIWKRLVDTCTMAMLVVFTLFLGYSALSGRTDSCHCMGSLIELDPVKSIVKNALLIVLLLWAMKARPWNWKPRWYVWLWPVLAPFVVVFTVSAPDNWLFGAEDELYNAEEFAHAIGTGGDLEALHLDQGHHVLAFMTPGCPLCQMTDTKLTHICRRNNLDSAALIFLTPENDSTVAPLTLDTAMFLRPCYKIPSMTFALITYGQRPIVFLVEDGKVVGTCHSRNIEEKRIVDFIPQHQQ